MFMLVFGQLAQEIPLAVLASILIMMGITRFDYVSLKILMDETRTDAAFMIVKIILTVAVMVAVGVGIVMSGLDLHEAHEQGRI